MSSGRSKKVKVWVRTRPTSHFAHDTIGLQSDGRTVNIHCKRDARKGVVNNQILDWSFKMDGILHNASQENMYETCAQDVVSAAIDGYNGTVMAYGQTGAGKTFSITGATENYKHRGIIPRALSHIYREIEDRPECAISVRVSYLEIYNETMFDLLASLPESYTPANVSPMAVVEDIHGVYVKGLSCHLAQNEEECLNLLFEGETNRAIAAHSLNKASSRSHCIFTVYIESRSRVQSEAKYTTAKLNFVDLAGSERLGKTKSEGKTQQEAMYINKSLTFLEQTIIALADRRRDHIPFRQTKLTHYLKDSIGGNCRTVLIANVWGEQEQIEETISTLRFATRMMCVNSEPAVNEHYDPTIMVKKLEKEVDALKHELAMHDTLNNRSHVLYDPLSEQQKYEITQQVSKYLEGELEQLDVVNVRQIQGVFEAFKDIYLQVERDVEERLRAKYTMMDRADPTAVAPVQPTGPPVVEDMQLVGEPDRQNFGVGQLPKSGKAEPSSVVNAKKREMKKKSKERASPTGMKGPGSPGSGRDQDTSTPHTPSRTEKERETTTPSSSGGDKIVKPQMQQRPSTPPPRTVAFEEFKQERGSEINRILNENKEIHAAKKKAYSQLANQINMTKVKIDNTKMRLEALRQEREANGIMFNEEGEIIITEEEFLEVKKLKEAKAQYKQDADELRHLKSEAQYCQKLVDQCRQKLIHEFDTWYSECFLDSSSIELQTSALQGYGSRAGTLQPGALYEDEQEKFDRLQMELLLENPDSAAFYNAKMRTERRKTYEAAMSQPQPAMRRKPGTPTKVIRSTPPSMLQVQ
ncbi:kinesin-like protein KIF9 [Lineus longissimus]|uniref:kinesin-like protein KIF9 n=1 Tax=Lineus longissimus TaxID=88925 RepID=UPI002B4E59C5